MADTLYLVAGMAERTARIVWIGARGQWQYDKPNGLPAFTSKSDAEALRLRMDKTVGDIFGAIFGSSLFGGPTQPIGTPSTPSTPTLKNVRVVTLERKKP